MAKFLKDGVTGKLLGGGSGLYQTPEFVLGEKSITENGTYTASEDSLDGYSQVSVDCPVGVTVIEGTITPVTRTQNITITGIINTPKLICLYASESGSNGQKELISVANSNVFRCIVKYNNIVYYYHADNVASWAYTDDTITITTLSSNDFQFAAGVTMTYQVVY